jgi:hypothetical protein
MKLILLFIAFLALSFNLKAYDFAVDNIYYNITSSTNQTVEVTYASTSYNSYSGSVTIPSSVTNSSTSYSVTSIGSYAFSRCNGLTSITIPSSVTSIGYNAFRYCTGLTSITIPSSVSSIGSLAFEYCTGLTSINVDDSNTTYSSSDGVLFNINKSTLICYPSSKTGTTYTIPSSVTSIDNYAFSYCSGLTSITIPSSITSIGNYAFSYCTGLTSITIPSSVTSIGSYAFYNCNGLTSINVDDSNTTYSSSDGVLFNINKSTLICYPSSKTGTTYTIPSSVTSISSDAFSYCTRLTSITIPSSVTYIGSYAFYYCTGLTSITIPSSVTSISVGEFYYCSGLTSITIPSSVTSIGSSAFDNCTGLTSIYVYHTTPLSLSSSSNIFYYVPTTTCILYVPSGSKDLYAAATVWQDFSNIVEMSYSDVNTISSNNAITISTNPSTDAIYLTGFEGNASVAVYNLNGQLLLSQTITAGSDISSQNLPGGVYIAKIKTSSGEISKKFIKQ